MSVQLTDSAIEKVNEIMTQENQAGKALRIYVEGGGCSGFQYGFSFDDPRDTDEVVDYKGFKLLVDPFSMNYLQNCQVDYVDGLSGAGFRISNPNASGSCGWSRTIRRRPTTCRMRPSSPCRSRSTAIRSQARRRSSRLRTWRRIGASSA